MRTLQRNRKVVFYALPTGRKTKARDSFGNYTGEPIPEYTTPQRYSKLSAMNNKGVIMPEAFGLSDNYETSLVTTDMACPIKEGARLWVGICPCNADGTEQPYTHLVKAVLPTINGIKVVIESVKVS